MEWATFSPHSTQHSPPITTLGVCQRPGTRPKSKIWLPCRCQIWRTRADGSPVQRSCRVLQLRDDCLCDAVRAPGVTRSLYGQTATPFLPPTIFLRGISVCVCRYPRYLPYFGAPQRPKGTCCTLDPSGTRWRLKFQAPLTSPVCCSLTHTHTHTPTHPHPHPHPLHPYVILSVPFLVLSTHSSL